MTDVVKGRYYPEMPPALDGETDDTYTNRLTGADRTDRIPYDHKRNRQCSIGYHRECSERQTYGAEGGGQCQCPCHLEPLPLTSISELILHKRYEVSLDCGHFTAVLNLIDGDGDAHFHNGFVLYEGYEGEWEAEPRDG